MTEKVNDEKNPRHKKWGQLVPKIQIPMEFILQSDNTVRMHEFTMEFAIN